MMNRSSMSCIRFVGRRERPATTSLRAIRWSRSFSVNQNNPSGFKFLVLRGPSIRAGSFTSRAVLKVTRVGAISVTGPALQHTMCTSSAPTQRRWLSSSSSEYPVHTLFPMPALSPTMERGSIGTWALKEGDVFAAGDVLCSIETDKASVDFEAQDDGVLAKILVPPGQDVTIGTPICVVTEDVDDVQAFANYVISDSAPAAASESTEADTTATTSFAVSGTITPASTPSLLLPSARHLAESSGKDATVLQGSGKGGRVTKGDVLTALKADTMPDLVKIKAAAVAPVAATPVAPSVVVAAAATPTTTTSSTPPIDLPIPKITTSSNYEDVPNNKMRKIIASRLTDSKRNVPHSYTSVQVALDNVLKLRKQLASLHDVKVSVNDFVIRCSALALRDVPEVNGTYDPVSNTVRRNPSIDVSVAVATPTGLITPIVFNSDQLGLAEITNKIRDLATRARSGALQPHEYQGGTFSVSNLGMFGISEFSAVINPPQAAILAVGGGNPQIVPTPFDETKTLQDPPIIRTIMTARLSADRRVVDEPTAALFLQAFTHYMEKPELLLL